MLKRINQSIRNILHHLINKIKSVKNVSNVYYLTKKEIEEFKLSKSMDLLEISSCTDLNRLRIRRKFLFNKLVNKRGSSKDIIEMMRIVQRLYELNEPFYY